MVAITTLIMTISIYSHNTSTLDKLQVHPNALYIYLYIYAYTFIIYTCSHDQLMQHHIVAQHDTTTPHQHHDQHNNILYYLLLYIDTYVYTPRRAYRIHTHTHTHMGGISECELIFAKRSFPCNIVAFVIK